MNDLILAFRATHLNVEMHKHAAMQLVYSEDLPFSAIIDGEQYKDIMGFFICPQVPHLCETVLSSMVIINIEVDSLPAIFLKERLLRGVDKCIIFSHKELLSYFNLPAEGNINNIYLQLIKNLSIDVQRKITDERVSQIIEKIRIEFQKPINPRLLAKDIFLSHSRLSSLFTQQTGSNISKFILWTRLRQCVHQLLTEKDLLLTDIAFQNGFYDLANMNKYIYQVFGLSPTALRKNSNLIQIL